jgi:hypothetical protein
MILFFAFIWAELEECISSNDPSRKTNHEVTNRSHLASTYTNYPMNTVYQTTLIDQPMQTRIEHEEYAVHAVGTFAGTIYKGRYLSNGSFVPSDTSEQLIADGLR